MIVDCPICQYKLAMSITKRNGTELQYCHAGCGTIWNDRPVTYIRPPERKPHDTPRDNYILDLWKKSLPAKGTLVEVYLNSRGIKGRIPETIRFLKDHKHTPTNGIYPVMLAAVTDAVGQLKAVHRTYLRLDGSGKAEIERSKMTLGAIGGFSCHLSSLGDAKRVIVCEGIETGLSIQMGRSIPVLSALCAGGMEKLILPESVRQVIICADHDEPGIRSARIARERFDEEGRSTKFMLPPEKGQDYNDFVVAKVKSKVSATLS